jgi:hypothetical protein
MGFRTVVILQNDRCSEWSKDANLGQRIASAMNHVTPQSGSDIGYGQVVECAHADTQTIALIDNYNFTALAYRSWSQNESEDNIILKLIKEAALKFGFRLVKIPEQV